MPPPGRDRDIKRQSWPNNGTYSERTLKCWSARNPNGVKGQQASGAEAQEGTAKGEKDRKTSGGGAV